MISLKCFIPTFDIFSPTHEGEMVWPDGTHPILFAESNFFMHAKF